MISHRLTALSPLLLLAIVAGCKASISGYAAFSTGDEAKRWKAFDTGQRVVVSDPLGTCGMTWAATAPALHGAEAAPVAKAEWLKTLTVWTIADASPFDDTSGDLQLELAAAGRRVFVRVPAEQKDGCLYPTNKSIEAAAAAVGKAYAFTPWKPSCLTLEARGASPKDALSDAESGDPMKVVRVVVGPLSATASAWSPSDGAIVWYGFAGDLAVRADTFQGCFTATKPGADDEPKPRPFARLRLDPSRCTSDTIGGKEHLACSTSLGVWEGALREDGISMRFVRRTLGAIHFLDGKPVEGSPFARAVVSIAFDAAGSPQEERLYSYVKGSASAAMAGGDADVRLVDAADASASTKVTIGVSGIQIGDVVVSESSETAQYKAGTETKPNPKKAELRDAVGDAKQAVKDANDEYRRSLDEWEQNKANLDAQCKQNLTSGGTTGATNCDSATALAGAAMKPSNDGVQRAERRLSELQDKLADEPETIETDVMKSWTYKKKTYARTVSAALKMATASAAGTKNYGQSFSFTASDYDVQADPEHNVSGHSADKGFVDDPQLALPQLAMNIAERVKTELLKGIDESLVEQATKAFVEAGNEPSKPEYVKVDALAYQAVTARLRKVVRRGEVTLSEKKSLTLPSSDASVGGNECLLAVAVSGESGDVRVALATEDGAHADLRGKTFAVVEVCPNDFPGSKATVPIQLTGNGIVRWGLYRTAGRSTKAEQ